MMGLPLRISPSLVAVSAFLMLVSAPGVASANEIDESTNLDARSYSEYGSSVTESDPRQAAGNCGVRVDLPHPSRTTNNQIHTRVESFCQGNTIADNTITGKSYRSRWYGWQHMRTESNGPRTTWRVRVTVDVNCDKGSRHRWRTEGFGSGVLNGQPVSASAYEQNDSEITCGANN